MNTVLIPTDEWKLKPQDDSAKKDFCVSKPAVDGSKDT